MGHIDKQVRINRACIADELNKHTEDYERHGNVNNDSIPLENNQQNLQCNRQGEELIQAHLNNPYQLLKRKATSKFNQMIATPGDWAQWDQNTVCKIKPNQEDMQMLKSVATELITSDPKTQPTQFLWEANCAIYLVAYTWKTKYQKTRVNQQNRNKFKPKWMKHIESQMNLLRREISQITEEIKRLKANGRITRKVGRNRKWMRQELKGQLSIKSLHKKREENQYNSNSQVPKAKED